MRQIPEEHRDGGPCPFCGGPTSIFFDSDGKPMTYRQYCRSCDRVGNVIPRIARVLGPINRKRRLQDREFDAAYAKTLKNYGISDRSTEVTPVSDVTSYIRNSIEDGLLRDGEGWVVAGLEIPLAEEVNRRGYRLEVIDRNVEYVHVLVK